jgi:predicted glycosyltransferase
MKRLMFYCQHILGMGHLVRSMEIVRGLVHDFQVCFINGGEVVKGFTIPEGIEVINLPAIKTDAEFQTLRAVDESLTLSEVQEIRKTQLLEICDHLKPDVLMIELFPFGRGKFSFELIPLIERARSNPRTKVVCSLRDIVVTKRDTLKYEQKVCKLMNQYFDLLLVHGDPQFQPLEMTFSRVGDLQCPVHYTGYVVQPQPSIASTARLQQPLILVSVGGGRFGHDLLNCVLQAAPILAKKLPHKIQIFTGPFMLEEKFSELQEIANQCPNVQLERFTPNLLTYMQQADLSISMSGYNTTMNVLTTGVKAMILPFTGNDDQEQTIRASRLEELGVVDMIRPEDLQPDRFAAKVFACLQKQPNRIQFDFDGVAKTAALLNDLVTEPRVA